MKRDCNCPPPHPAGAMEDKKNAWRFFGAEEIRTLDPHVANVVL